MLSVFPFIRCLKKQSTLLSSISVDDLIIPATPHISQETEPKLRNSNLLAVFQTVMSGTDGNVINLNRSLSLTQFSTIPMLEIVIKTLSKKHFREPLSLNCWGLAWPKSLCAHASNSILIITLTQHLFLAESQGHRHGFCPRALGKPQSQKESHFLPPELLFHSSALARSLLGSMLSCLIFRSFHIP